MSTFPVLIQFKEDWMIYRGPSFLSVLCFGSTPAPSPPPLPTANCVSFSVFLCVAGPAYWPARGGRVGSRIIRMQESFVLYKLFNTLWPNPTTLTTALPMYLFNCLPYILYYSFKRGFWDFFELRTVVTLALKARRSNHSARSHSYLNSNSVT
jgi:hypothetical protein